MSKPFLDNIIRYPINIVRGGGGALLIGDDGKNYLDFWSDESTQGLGYGPTVSAIAEEYFRGGRLHQLPDIYPNRTRTALAERLCATYGFDRVFFNNSGAEAIETAIKVARKYHWERGNTLKKRIYTLKGNFHGRTAGALALSDSIGSGSPYHKIGFGATESQEILVKIGEPWQGYGVIDEALPLGRQLHSDTTAAIFMAPILGNNVVKEYDPRFLVALREFCTDNDILLVFDEIQTGSGWTGSYSAAQHYRVQPDIMTLGKRIALGFPMTATLFAPGIGEAIGLGEHFNTFAGSPFVCAMANVWLDWLGDGGLERIAYMGEQTRAMLRDLPWVNQVNGVGMMISFKPDYIGYTAVDLCAAAQELGLLIVSHRALGEIRFTPPCSTPIGQVREAVDILAQAFAVVTR